MYIWVLCMSERVKFDECMSLLCNFVVLSKVVLCLRLPFTNFISRNAKITNYDSFFYWFPIYSIVFFTSSFVNDFIYLVLWVSVFWDELHNSVLISFEFYEDRSSFTRHKPVFLQYKSILRFKKLKKTMAPKITCVMLFLILS